MKYAVPIARVLLGLPFLVFGLNFFFRFMEPEVTAQEALAFQNALAKTGFMNELRSLAEIVSGGLLVLGLFVPLALVILAPVLATIVGYHVYLDPGVGQFGITAVLVVLFLLQAWVHRANFKCLLNARPKPPAKD